jgi:hypothetical protein
MATNIFDTRHIINQTPKMGNRFLLTADGTRLGDIVNGSPTSTKNGTATTYGVTQPISKMKKMNQLAGGNDEVFGSVTDANKKTVDILNLSLLSCTIPAFEFESAEINHFNDSIKHITKFSASNDMSAVFYDYINGSSAAIMLAWQTAVGFKLTGEINYKKKYTCDMDLFVYGPNRPGYKVFKDATINKVGTQASPGESQESDQPQYELLMQLKIINAYPRSVDLSDYSYDAAEIKKVTVQFGYDMIIPYKNKVRNKEKPLNVQDMKSHTDDTYGAEGLKSYNNDQIENSIYVQTRSGNSVAGDTIGTGA